MRIRDLREDHNLTQADIAKMLHIKQTLIRSTKTSKDSYRYPALSPWLNFTKPQPIIF